MTLVTRGLLDVLAAERVAVEHPVTGDDFLFDQGTIGIAPRGKQILSGFATLIRAVMPAIDIAFDGLHAAAGSFLDQGKQATLSASVHFCLSCAYRPAYRHYGRSQASLFVDALFANFYGRLPSEELYQRYLENPRVFPHDEIAEEATTASVPPFCRIYQFVVDVLGDLRAKPIILLNAPVTQFMIDAKAILEATVPDRKADELADSFLARAVEFWNPPAGTMREGRMP